jgi:hypothetical protein
MVPKRGVLNPFNRNFDKDLFIRKIMQLRFIMYNIFKLIAHLPIDGKELSWENGQSFIKKTFRPFNS